MLKLSAEILIFTLLWSLYGVLSYDFRPRIGRLSVDYGPRSIGIAHGDYLGVVRPYATVQNRGTLDVIAEGIVTLARQQSVSELIVGIPVDSNGLLHYNVHNFNGQLCLNFTKVLSAVADHLHPNKFQVLLFDERYTTKEAALRLQTEKKLKASLDAMSAACLLERFIEDRGEGAIQAERCEYPIPPELNNFDYNTVRKHVRSLYAEKDRYR